jgi:ankyrin repeat protein
LEASVTLAYASCFGRVREAEIFLQRSGGSALQHQLELLETVGETRELQGMSLHIAANFKRPEIVQLFIKYRADPNAINFYRFSVLCAVISLYTDMDSSVP